MRTDNDNYIENLSNVFSENITERKYSCADIQGYFINHKYEPEYVVEQKYFN